MSCVHKVGWLSDHTSVNPSSPLRLRLLCNTAVETQPEFTHALSPRPERAPPRAPSLQTGSSTTCALRARNVAKITLFHRASVPGVKCLKLIERDVWLFLFSASVSTDTGSRSVGRKEQLWFRDGSRSLINVATHSALWMETMLKDTHRRLFRLISISCSLKTSSLLVSAFVSLNTGPIWKQKHAVRSQSCREQFSPLCN